MSKMREGWAKIFNLETERMLGRFHYFRDGTSLCGKYMLTKIVEDLAPERGLTRFRCVICLKLIKAQPEPINLIERSEKMKFEDYIPSTRIYPHNSRPYIHFSKGCAWINKAGLLKYFSGYGYVKLSFCLEEEVVGLIPAYEKTEGSLKLSRSTGSDGRFISMQGFYHKFPIRKITKRLGRRGFPIEESEESKRLLVYLR